MSVEARQCTVQVRPHDRTRPTQRDEGRCAEHVRTLLGLDLPQPLHHELQHGGLDVVRLAGDDCLGQHEVE